MPAPDGGSIMTSSRVAAIDRAALEREAVRLCRRYIDEVVLPFDLCPWAAPALRQQRVEILTISEPVEQVGTELEAAADQGARALAACARRTNTELVLLIYPLFRLGRYDFDVLLRALRDRHAPTHYVMAAFHPQADLDSTNAERLVPFLRRSPDPMVQAVRSDVLERINPGRGTGTAFVSLDRFLAGDLESAPELSPRERVARANWEAVQRLGSERLTDVLASIHDDRLRTYRSLGLLDEGAT